MLITRAIRPAAQTLPRLHTDTPLLDSPARCTRLRLGILHHTATLGSLLMLAHPHRSTQCRARPREVVNHHLKEAARLGLRHRINPLQAAAGLASLANPEKHHNPDPARLLRGQHSILPERHRPERRLGTGRQPRLST